MPIPTSDRPFDRLAGELVADQLAADPVLGSTLGLTEYDGLLPDLSEQAIAARERSEDSWLERFRALPDAELDADEQIDRDLVVMVLQGRAAQRDWADWRRSPDHYAGAALASVFGLLMHRLRPEPELAAVVAARLTATPTLLEQGIANLDPALAHPALVRRALGMAQAGAVYARAVAAEIDDEQGRELVAAAGEEAGVAFERFGAHLETLAEAAHGEWAIGEERYDALLRNAEGLSYGTRDLRERGQVAYDELAADLRQRAEKLRGDDDWRAQLDELSADHPETPEEMLSLYREATAAARAFCVENELVTMPEGERCEVVPSAPFTRAMVAVAHYSVPPPFAPGDNAGHFFVPYPPDGATPEQVAARLATNNRHGLWSITVHEAYPGHHWHFAWLAGNPDNPGRRALRAVFGSTYFVEGWGLYTEDLLREQGFFATPEQELCQRDFRLFRAARIIVDTSLHLGEMTIEEAVDFMSTKASLSRDTAQAEVLRYCAWPTQASSYLTGALELDRMRQRWFNEARGSLRDFHDRAAGSGRLPISLVERALFG
ncbi:MAG: DUF885 domain-containing protein [Sporichthyaceae bacterium]